MKRWRLPVQGFSLRPVLRRREFSDDADAAEFMKAEAIVLRGLSKATCPNFRRFEVVKVEIVENPRLKRKYDAKKAKEVEDGSSGESLMLFHGTPKENILPIVQYNFDPSIINNGRAFGDGVYFSECPELSLGYTFRGRGQRGMQEPEDGNFTLILCEVLKGSLPVFKEHHDQGDTSRASVIVVTDVDRLLPRYVVTLGRPTSINDPDPTSQILTRSSFPRPGSRRCRSRTTLSGNPLLSAQSLLSPRAGQPAPVLPPVFQGSVSAPVLPSHLAPGSSWMSHPDVLGNPPFFLNTLPQVTHSSWWRGSWNFLPSTPAPAAPSQTAPAVPLQPAPAVPSQPAPPVPSLPSTYSPALTACTCCGEPGWRRTQCRHSSTPSTSMDASTAVTESGGVRLSLSQDQNGNSDTLILFSAESPNIADDPPVVDPVTDALAAATYKVLEQLELKVSQLWNTNGIAMKVTLKLVSDSGVEQEIVVPYHEPVVTSLEDYCEKTGTNMVNMKLVFDGRTVLLGETPESLGMEDGDMVEVMTSSGERPLSSEAVRLALSQALSSMSIRVFRKSRN